jgi:hypothetical protein
MKTPCTPRFPVYPDLGWSLGQLLGHERIRYFSHGRHALVAALQAIDIRPGEDVLLPAFICRDLLASLHAVGARPVWYETDERLELSTPVDALPPARAILAVNYFGMPQPLEPFRAYCARTGAALIEDNAHGLLSRDTQGRALGSRGDFGIFSLRKTLALPDGAALAFNRPGDPLPDPLPESSLPPSGGYRFKQGLRRVGPLALRSMTDAARLIRRLRTGHDIPPPAPDAEVELPGPGKPCTGLSGRLAHLDEVAEIQRRRTLYRWLAPLLVQWGARPVWPELPDGAAPYVVPFYADDATAARIQTQLRPCYLECSRWPDLPDQLAAQAPLHHRTVWMVGFL